MERDRIIKVSGCHACPCLNKIGFIHCNRIPEINILPNYKSKTINQYCPLEKEGEAESRLKTWLAVREEELYYARVGVVKHIKIAQNLHKNKSMKCQSKTGLICIAESLLYAISLTIKQADGESNKT